MWFVDLGSIEHSDLHLWYTIAFRCSGDVFQECDVKTTAVEFVKLSDTTIELFVDLQRSQNLYL
jgi:hypothetical protein